MLNFDEICHLFYGDNVPQDGIEDDWDRDYEPDPDLQVKAAKEDALIDYPHHQHPGCGHRGPGAGSAPGVFPSFPPPGPNRHELPPIPC